MVGLAIPKHLVSNTSGHFRIILQIHTIIEDDRIYNKSFCHLSRPLFNIMYSRNLIYKGHKAEGGGWGAGRESLDYEFLPLDYS